MQYNFQHMNTDQRYTAWGLSDPVAARRGRYGRGLPRTRHAPRSHRRHQSTAGAIADEPDARLRFEREARAIASLNHPHICALYDIGRQDDQDYLVMEYLEGETLAERIAKGPLPIPSSCCATRCRSPTRSTKRIARA